MPRIQTLTYTSLQQLQSMRIEYGPSLVYFPLFSPWVNTCIGFYNRKAFILMLFYTTVIATLNILALVLCIQPIV